MDCTIHVAKTKAQISFAVTAKLICVFVFAYAKIRFSHNEAHVYSVISGHISMFMYLVIGNTTLFCLTDYSHDRNSQLEAIFRDANWVH